MNEKLLNDLLTATKVEIRKIEAERNKESDVNSFLYIHKTGQLDVLNRLAYSLSLHHPSLESIFHPSSH